MNSEMAYCIAIQHGRRVTWVQTKNCAFFCSALIRVKHVQDWDTPIINSSFRYMRVKNCHNSWGTKAKNWIVLHVKEVCDLKQSHMFLCQFLFLPHLHKLWYFTLHDVAYQMFSSV